MAIAGGYPDIEINWPASNADDSFWLKITHAT
jgi:hypothetical protein